MWAEWLAMTAAEKVSGRAYWMGFIGHLSLFQLKRYRGNRSNSFLRIILCKTAAQYCWKCNQSG
jgi:hypothetical protein